MGKPAEKSLRRGILEGGGKEWRKGADLSRTGEYCQQPSTTLPQLWRSLLGLGARVCPLGVRAEHRVNLSGAQVHEELRPVMGQNNHQEPGLNYSPSRPRCPVPT